MFSTNSIAYDFVKLLLCRVVPILLIVMLVSFICYYKQKKNNNIIGEEKRYIYICAVIIEIILFLNISAYLEFSAILLVFGFIGISLIISMTLRVFERENLSNIVMLISLILTAFLNSIIALAGGEKLGLSIIGGWIISFSVLFFPIIFAGITIKFIKDKFYLCITNIALFIHYYTNLLIYPWRINLLTFITSILILGISAIYLDKKRIFKIIYCITIIYIFISLAVNIFSGNSGYSEFYYGYETIEI